MYRCLDCLRCGCLPKRGVYCQILTAILLLVASLLTYPLFDAIILNVSQKKIVMTKENYALWGNIPGDSGSVIIRELYVNQVTNPRAVIYLGQAAIVQEIGPFSY